MGPIVVIKVGTSSLVDTASRMVKVLSVARVADTTARLRTAGYDVIIVTSGAVGLGCIKLGLQEKPTTVAGKQAAAAVGQLKLLSLYDDVFSQLGVVVAQVLLTYDAFGDRAQYMNARNTFHALLSQRCVPIVNENDTVAVQELRVGDNDSLSALVSNMVGAKWLFLLTDVDSLYTANPRVDASATPIRLVRTSEQVHTLRKQMVSGVGRLDPDATLQEEGTEDGASVSPEGRGAGGLAGSTTPTRDGLAVGGGSGSCGGGGTGSSHVPEGGVGQEGSGPGGTTERTGVAAGGGGQQHGGAASAERGSPAHAGGGRRSRSPATAKVSGFGSAGVSSTSGAAAVLSVGGGQGKAGSTWGTGGMETKLRAALLGTAAGVTVVIMNSERIDAVHSILSSAAKEATGGGEGGALVASAAGGGGGTHPSPPSLHIPPLVQEHSAAFGARSAASRPTLFADKGEGTTFLPAPAPVTGRKRWILSLAPQGSLVLDAGATAAVVDQRKSLYCAGVVSVRGDFSGLDAVVLVDASGRVLAHALINYNSVEAGKLKGRHSKEFSELLGYQGAEALCDRDNVVLL